MNRLPDPTQPTAPQAGQTDRTDDTLRRAAAIAAAVDDVYQPPTRFRDHSPLPTIGSMPPVQQPGTPAMSQKATDISRVLLAAGCATVPPGLVTTLILVASENANPTVIGWICAAPVLVAVPVLALTLLVRGIKNAAEAAPPEIHQHFNGTVHQDHSSHEHRSNGMWVRNNHDHSTNL